MLVIIALGILLLAHGDDRYTILAAPVLAAFAALAWLAGKKSRSIAAWRPLFAPGRAALVFLAAVCFMSVLELDGFRFRRSESGVEMARYLARLPEIQSAAVEQAWAAGGRLYLGGSFALTDIDPERIQDQSYFLIKVQPVGLQAVGLRADHAEGLGYASLLKSLGFNEVAFSTRKTPHPYRLFLKKGR